jgi:hypothetical protein
MDINRKAILDHVKRPPSPSGPGKPVIYKDGDKTRFFFSDGGTTYSGSVDLSGKIKLDPRDPRYPEPFMTSGAYGALIRSGERFYILQSAAHSKVYLRDAETGNLVFDSLYEVKAGGKSVSDPIAYGPPDKGLFFTFTDSSVEFFRVGSE